MPIKVSDFESLTQDLDEIFVETAKQSVAEMVGKTIFDVTDTNMKNFEYQVLHGMNVIREVPEGSDLPDGEHEEGDSIIYTQARFGGKVPVTKDMRKFDEYSKINDLVESVSAEAFDKVDQSMADVLLNGWSTTYTDVYNKSRSAVCPDGKQLFSTAHTNPINSRTFSNVITDGNVNNPPLSRKAIIKSRVKAAKYKDVAGISRPVKLDTLLVPMELEDKAMRIVNSASLPGSANNDVNPLKNKITVKTWERLDIDGQGNTEGKKWFLYDSSRVDESLKLKFAERPALDAPEEVYANKNWNYTIDYYNTLGRGWPVYIMGSDSSGS